MPTLIVQVWTTTRLARRAASVISTEVAMTAPAVKTTDASVRVQYVINVSHVTTAPSAGEGKRQDASVTLIAAEATVHAARVPLTPVLVLWSIGCSVRFAAPEWALESVS